MTDQRRRDTGAMKAMRIRIALQKHFVRNSEGRVCRFAEVLGVRTRPRVAFTLVLCDYHELR
ncbi:MAG: hypothetical protein DME98_07325 [Verrucomicrobia bacterium]|nr:MAG: hypothetical protein DME98_07325 [Verrucomicrobiota bacterium]